MSVAHHNKTAPLLGSVVRAARLTLAVAVAVVALAVLAQGARLALRPDRRDDLRRGDALFAAGSYHAALATYTALTVRAPDGALGWARRGMVEAVRGETARADASLATALRLGLRGDDHDLARLYQGAVAASAGRRSEAASVWATIGDAAALRPLRRALEAERRLRSGDYAAAEVQFRAISLETLPAEWRALVRSRLAALRAASDADAALALLAPQTAASAQAMGAQTYAQPSLAALVAPLLPSGGPDDATLLAALRADAAQRPQMLGQVYLDSGLYALAEAQFSRAAAGSTGDRAAAAYAAYTRWQAGDRAGGVARLAALVAAHPADPRARALLALTYLATDDAPRAQAQLDVIRALAPRAPDTHLAWGQWYAAQHDYLAAAAEYRQALNEAQTAQRGGYALALARFQLDTNVQPCATGVPAAAEATARLPADPRAWTTLAGLRFRCGDAQAAQAAAQAALARDPTNAEATYYLGRALAVLGDRSAARAALVSAADLAPASAWRERAEKQLAVLGL